MNYTPLMLAVVMLSMVAPASAGKRTEALYAQERSISKEAKVNNQADDFFFIMPWGSTPGNEQALKDIKECGFNVAGFVSPGDVRKCKKAGLRCIVLDGRISGAVRDEKMSDAEIAKRVESVVSKFKGDPTVYGYYVMDEPTAPLFRNLARWADAIHKVDPSAYAYINLLPIGAQGPGSKDYMDYLEQFVKVIRPTNISYDHYTLYDDGSYNPSLFRNLDALRTISLKHNIPFWNIVLANSHFHYAEVTQGGLYLQAYATLAYGAHGISYFTYFAPQIGNYRNAAIDQFMHKTPTWDMLRLVNLQLNTLAPTYMKLKSVNVFHTPDVPDGLKGIDSSKYLAEVGGGSFLVGEFEGPNGTPYVMLVNKDIHKSTSFDVKFRDQGTVMMTSSYNGSTSPFGGENGWLGPGSGVLLSLQKQK